MGGGGHGARWGLVCGVSIQLEASEVLHTGGVRARCRALLVCACASLPWVSESGGVAPLNAYMASYHDDTTVDDGWWLVDDQIMLMHRGHVGHMM